MIDDGINMVKKKLSAQLKKHKQKRANRNGSDLETVLKKNLEVWTNIYREMMQGHPSHTQFYTNCNDQAEPEEPIKDAVGETWEEEVEEEEELELEECTEDAEMDDTDSEPLDLDYLDFLEVTLTQEHEVQLSRLSQASNDNSTQTNTN